MGLKFKFWLILAPAILLVMSAAAWLDYRSAKELAQLEMRREALDMRAVLMATRRIYHRQFLASGLPLNDRTLGFLPAHAMTRIAQDYPNWSRSGVRFNNVSDTPRNPANRADRHELAAIAWFRANPMAEEFTARIWGTDGKEYFHYAAPIWTEPYCLECHSTPEAAPATVRERYAAGYGYRLGDLRGVMSIRIPADSSRELIMQLWQRKLLEQGVVLAILLVLLNFMLNRFVGRPILDLQAAARRMREGARDVRVPEHGDDEIGQLARDFNAMAGAVAERDQSMRESEEKYRVLADYSSEWEFWLGPDGRFRYVSPACRQVCGHGPAEFLADPDLFERLLHPDDVPAWRRHQTPTARPGQPRRHAALPLRILGTEGSYRWIEHDCIAVFDASGHDLGRRGVNRDITERQRREELERFGAFQAGIAEMSTSILHNVGNAITALTQDAEAIEHSGAELRRIGSLLEGNARHSEAELAGPAADPAALALRQIGIQHEAARAIGHLFEEELTQRTHRLGQSAHHIADIVRIQQSAAVSDSRCSRFNLSQAIASALELQGDAFSKRGIRVDVAVDAAADTLNLPLNRLLQALVNILRNSLEALAEPGVDLNRAPGIEIRAEPLGPKRIRIVVSDNGAGFAAEARDSLFRFGYSTKRRGSGFGLHSVAVFAQEVGGTVRLESDGPGQGARLTLELPRDAGAGHGGEAAS